MHGPRWVHGVKFHLSVACRALAGQGCRERPFGDRSDRLARTSHPCRTTKCHSVRSKHVSHMVSHPSTMSDTPAGPRRHARHLAWCFALPYQCGVRPSGSTCPMAGTERRASIRPCWSLSVAGPLLMDIKDSSRPSGARCFGSTSA
jgi:hypothetical protein